MKNILFICTGNTCRSPMAQAIMNKLLKEDEELFLKAQASSAGISAFTGDSLNDSAAEALKLFGIEMRDHFARRINDEIVDQADIILAMEKRHLEQLLHLHPVAADKAYTLLGYANQDDGGDIADPYCMGAQVYEATARLLFEAIGNVISRLD